MAGVFLLIRFNYVTHELRDLVTMGSGQSEPSKSSSIKHQSNSIITPIAEAIPIAVVWAQFMNFSAPILAVFAFAVLVSVLVVVPVRASLFSLDVVLRLIRESRLESRLLVTLKLQYHNATRIRYSISELRVLFLLSQLFMYLESLV